MFQSPETDHVREPASGSLSDEYADRLGSEEESQRPETPATIREKYRGAILGAAIGDALGSVYEGTPRPVPEEIQYLLSDPHDLRYTDDTAMTIALAESLLARSAFDQDHMAETFRLRTGSSRDAATEQGLPGSSNR